MTLHTSPPLNGYPGKIDPTQGTKFQYANAYKDLKIIDLINIFIWDGLWAAVISQIELQ